MESSDGYHQLPNGLWLNMAPRIINRKVYENGKIEVENLKMLPLATVTFKDYKNHK